MTRQRQRENRQMHMQAICTNAPNNEQHRPQKQQSNKANNEQRHVQLLEGRVHHEKLRRAWRKSPIRKERQLGREDAEESAKQGCQPRHSKARQHPPCLCRMAMPSSHTSPSPRLPTCVCVFSSSRVCVCCVCVVSCFFLCSLSNNRAQIQLHRSLRDICEEPISAQPRLNSTNQDLHQFNWD